MSQGHQGPGRRFAPAAAFGRWYVGALAKKAVGDHSFKENGKVMKSERC